MINLTRVDNANLEYLLELVEEDKITSVVINKVNDWRICVVHNGGHSSIEWIDVSLNEALQEASNFFKKLEIPK